MTGTYEHSVDAKGRLSVPSRLRSDLGECFYVAKGPDNCLMMFPMESWQALEAKVGDRSMAESRNFRRSFFASAQRCDVDNQGRILLTSLLRDYASLEKDVIVIGVYDHAEIWSAEAWKRFEEQEAAGQSLADQMAELGL